MAQVREDKVQLRLDFVTDESGAFAKTIEETKKFNKEIQDTQKEIEKLEKEIVKMEEKDLSTIGTKQKLAEAQKRLTESINNSVTAGRSLAGLDLNNVAPDTLGQRLRQVNDELKKIPKNIRESDEAAIALVAESERLKAALASVRGLPPSVVEEVKLAVGSYEALRQEIQRLDAEVKHLVPDTAEFIAKSKELREVEAEFKRVEKSIKGIQDIKFADGSLESLNKQIKDLNDEIGKLAPDTEDFIAKSKKLSEVKAEYERVSQSIKGIPQPKFDNGSLGALKNRAAELRQEIDNRLTPGTQAFLDKMKELGLVNAEIHRVEGQIRQVTTAMNESRGAASGFSGLMQQAFGVFLGGGLLGIVQTVVGGVLSLGKSALKASADMEGLQTSVEVFLGSGRAATKFLRDIQKFAADTPFEFPELAEAGKKLLAFGYSGDAAMKLLKKLGDVASATQVPIAELSAIIGKAKLGEKIQGEELNQLADRGINVFPQLAKVLKVNTDQIKKMGSEGKIAYSDLEKAITMATEKGGQFYGMMDKQSRTFNGLMSTMTDNFNQFVQSLFGGIGEGLKPVIAGIGTFFGQLGDFIREGKKPVGEYAEVITFLASILKVLGNVFGIVWEAGKILLGFFLEQIKVVAFLGNRLGELIGWFVGVAAEIKKIPILGVLFKPILDAIGLMSDLLGNASATFAGFRAAAAQAITNVQNYFRALVLDAEIVGAKISSALSFNDKVKKQAADLVAARESQKAAMFNAGKTVEQAYTEGRNAAIVAQNKVEKEAETAKQAEKEHAKSVDEKAVAKAEKDRIKRAEDARELELRATSLYYDRDLLANEVALMQKQVTEKEAAEQELLIQQAKYEALLKIQKEYLHYFKKGTEEYLKAESAILELQKKKLPIDGLLNRKPVEETAALETKRSTGVESQNSNLDKIKSEGDLEQVALQQKFGRQLMSEYDFNDKLFKMRSDNFQRQLDEMIKNGQRETKEYKETADQKDKIDEKRVKNKKDKSEAEKTIEQLKRDMAVEGLGIAIDLLSQDEEARKKHGVAIKAFEIGQVWISAWSEIAGIWENAEKNPLNALIPGWGTAFATIKTAFSLGRATAATNKISAQKFAKGGLMQVLGGQSHSQGGTKGIFDDGTQVEMERGEVLAVVNKDNAPLLRMLSSINSANGNGVPYFADGGLLLPNTTPNPNQFFTPQYATVAPISGGSASSDVILLQMLAKFDELKVSVEKNREVKFYRNQLEDVTASDEEDRDLARWKL